MSLANRLSFWWEILRQLSPVTRVFLTVYALSIPVSWAVRYAPGEYFVELESVEPLSKPVVNLVFSQGGSERAMAAVVGESNWLILDWTKSETLTPDLSGLYAGRIDLKWAPWQALDSKAGLQLLAWQADELFYYRYGTGPKAVLTKRVPRDALWLRPSGGLVAAEDVYQNSMRAFGKKPHRETLWHVGRFVVARPETKRYVQKGKHYVQEPVADARHFLVFDGETGEAVSEVRTDLRVDGVYSAPRFHGLLYSSGSWLEVLDCNDERCKTDRVDLSTGLSKIRAASYDPKYDRIAVCAGDSLFLYAGAPGDEDIVHLGHGSLEDPCDELWIADESTLLLSLVEGLYAVASFRWIH